MNDKKDELWERCQKFISDQGITVPETIYQTDRIILNACELIEDICDIVGYKEREDDDFDEGTD